MTFRYSYSASVNKEVMEIRKRYLPKEESKLDELKRLDGQVKSAGMAEALFAGIMGLLLFGIGMCIGLGVIGGSLALAIPLGLIGTSAIISAYPVHKRVAAKAKEKYAPRILQLADEIQKNI